MFSCSDSRAIRELEQRQRQRHLEWQDKATSVIDLLRLAKQNFASGSHYISLPSLHEEFGFIWEYILGRISGCVRAVSCCPYQKPVFEETVFKNDSVFSF